MQYWLYSYDCKVYPGIIRFFLVVFIPRWRSTQWNNDCCQTLGMALHCFPIHFTTFKKNCVKVSTVWAFRFFYLNISSAQKLLGKVILSSEFTSCCYLYENHSWSYWTTKATFLHLGKQVVKRSGVQKVWNDILVKKTLVFSLISYEFFHMAKVCLHYIKSFARLGY